MIPVDERKNYKWHKIRAGEYVTKTNDLTAAYKISRRGAYTSYPGDNEVIHYDADWIVYRWRKPSGLGKDPWEDTGMGGFATLAEAKDGVEKHWWSVNVREKR